MRSTRFFVYASVPILMLFGGCNGGSNDMTASGPTQLDLTVTPNPTFAGAPVVFRVTAYNDHLALRSVRIDYTNDGTWDDTRTLDRSSATESFTYSYGAAGSYSVRVEVKDADDAPVATTIPVVVNNASALDITYKMYGTSPKGGECGAIGPPATCIGCAGMLLGTYTSAGVTMPVGTYPEGSQVRVSQNFVQNPYVGGGGRLLYSCQFQLLVFAKSQEGGQHQIGAGACGTNSMTSPAHLTCNADVIALVQ